jgi:hypothetical protein
MGEQQVVEDRVVAQAQAWLAHVDQEEVTEPHVEAERLGVGVLGLGLGGSTGDGDTAEQDAQQRQRRAGDVMRRMGPPWRRPGWLVQPRRSDKRCKQAKSSRPVQVAKRTRALSGEGSS